MKNKFMKLFKILKRKISKTLYLFVGWFIIVPLAFLIPRKKNLISFIGRDKGNFTDNVKYLYLYFHKKKTDSSINFSFFFITEDQSIYEILRNNNLRVLYYPSFKSIWTCLRSKYLIVDNMMWISNFKYFLFFGAKRIQLWHGVAFKRIHLDEPKYLGLNRRIKIILKLMGFSQKFHYLISTSPFYTEHLFKKAFKAGKILETGYPRNDILKNQKKYGKLSYINTDTKIIDKIKENKDRGAKIIIYMPTFRDSGRDFLKFLDLATFNKFGLRNNFLFIFKLHPDTLIKKRESLNNIMFYESSKDIYPVLPLSDLLITDYSSIYTDYLFLNKPILFFPFDKEEYIKDDRAFQFDYDEFTPGPKAYNQKELEKLILIIFKDDRFANRREKMKKLAFKFDDDRASDRIFDEIMKG